MKWRYFKYTDEGRTYIYRWPDNGKSLYQQDVKEVEVYRANGTWLDSQYINLVSEAKDGWFSEAQDEINEAEALILMAKFSAVGKK